MDYNDKQAKVLENMAEWGNSDHEKSLKSKIAASVGLMPKLVLYNRQMYDASETENGLIIINNSNHIELIAGPCFLTATSYETTQFLIQSAQIEHSSLESTVKRLKLPLKAKMLLYDNDKWTDSLTGDLNKYCTDMNEYLFNKYFNQGFLAIVDLIRE